MNKPSLQRTAHRASRLHRYSHRRALITTAVALGVMPSIAYAYVDPGIAGFLITTILGSIAAAGYLARQTLARMKRWLTGGTKPQPDSPQPDSPQPQPPGAQDSDIDGDADSRH